MALADIPAFLKHMTLAIYKNGSVGSGSQAFIRAFRIARGVMVRDGYLVDRIDGPTDGMRLTGKGIQRNGQHLREGPKKTREFDRLYENVQLAIEGEAIPDKPDTEKKDPAQVREENKAKTQKAGAKKKYAT
jgi:hypothetical protein